MDGENRFRLTKKADPEKYKKLVDTASAKLNRRNRIMRVMSEHLADNKE